MSDDHNEMIVFIRKTFLDEANFLLSDCEEALMEMEDEQKRSESIGEVFRIAHSLKGSGAAARYFDLSTFAHSIEDCLTVLRANPNKISKELIGLLLESFDSIKHRVQDFINGDDDKKWDVDDLVRRLQIATNEIEKKDNVPNLGEILIQSGMANREQIQKSLEAQELARNKKIGQYLVEDGAISDKDLSKAIEIQKTRKSAVAEKTIKEGKKSQSSGFNTIKISSDRIDSVMDLAGELVVIKSQIIEARRGSQHMDSLLELLDKTVREIYNGTLSMRMTPLKNLFLTMQRTVFDLSSKLGKEVHLETEGEDTELDRGIIEKIRDPLSHVVRNSLDHGLESKGERIASGKEVKGKITISAYNQGSNVVIKVADDGRGINKEKVLEKSIKKNLVPENASVDSMPEKDIFELLFAPGFSTAEQISEVSGRGVGMDVVKSNINAIKGSIEIESEEGKGTVMKMILPLTTAITDGVLIKYGEECFIIPVENIIEFLPHSSARITHVEGRGRMLDFREQFIPLKSIQPHLDDAMVARDLLVVLESDKKRSAIMVDQVLGQSQVVLKNLGSHVGDSNGFTGAAILGDGRVGLVVDVNYLIKSVA